MGRRALLVLFLAGCSARGALPISRWTLDAGEAAGARQVTLPAHLGLPDRPLAYTLRAEVELPPELRGRALTLVIPLFRASAALRAGGEPAVALETWVTSQYTTPGWHAWHIPESVTAGPTLRLELDVAHRTVFSGRLDTVPRLSATPHGDAAYVAASRYNETTLLAGLGVSGILGLIYLVSFLFDRRRVAHAGATVQALGGVALTAYLLGLTQPLLGEHDFAVFPFGAVFAGLGSVVFTRAHFHAGRAPRALFAALVPAAVAAPFVSGPFTGPRFGMLLASLIMAVTTTDVIRILWRERRGPRRADALLLSAAWALLYLTAVPDMIRVNGGGVIARLGLFTLPLGVILYGLLQMTVLGRERSQSYRQLEVLNEELRRQVADRAQKLAEALSRLQAAPSPRVLEPGDVVEARYRVIMRLGAGGMGTVYEVERLTGGRHLALKVMTGVPHREALARFAREAQLAAQLDHPNIVAVLDVDVARSGALYLVMELVGGGTLAGERARWGDAAWAVPILCRVADALAAMHARGIVHRDLKPANVLLDGNAPKVTDFGIASLTDSLPLEPTQEADTPLSPDAALKLTRTGAVVGTPLYLAPELVAGARDARPAADLWSFGVMAFELLVGRLPFAEPPFVARLRRRDPAPPDRLPEAVLEPVARALLDRCLDLDPAVRPSAVEVRDALARRT